MTTIAYTLKVINKTHGLYEHLFMEHPGKDVYNEEDLSAYRDIIKASLAHRLYHETVKGEQE